MVLIFLLNLAKEAYSLGRNHSYFALRRKVSARFRCSEYFGRKKTYQSFPTHLSTARRNFSDRCVGALSSTKTVGRFKYLKKSSIEEIKKSELIFSTLSYVRQKLSARNTPNKLSFLSLRGKISTRVPCLDPPRAISGSSKEHFHHQNINLSNHFDKVAITASRKFPSLLFQHPPTFPGATFAHDRIGKHFFRKRFKVSGCIVKFKSSAKTATTLLTEFGCFLISASTFCSCSAFCCDKIGGRPCPFRVINPLMPSSW